MPVHQIVESLREADIVGFSIYVWNVNICLEAARRLKEVNPDVCITFGGPQVPDNAEAFLRENPTIDLVFHNESENSFTDFLRGYLTKEISAIAGTSYIDDDGHFVGVPNGPRLKNLDDLPSPFLNGILDELIEANPDETWIGLWETNRGCPFKCSYCDWGSAVAAKVTKFQLDRLLLEADWISDRKIGYVFVCDANYGMLERDLEIARRVAKNAQRTGYPEGFSVQNTKNATERAYQTQKILADAGLNKGVALSMQSVSAEALKNIRRDNISLESYVELQERFTRDNVETFSDLILGLPGETYDSFVEGIDQLIVNGQHNRIQFNNCSILPNAEMGAPEYLEKYQVETVETEIINIHGQKGSFDDDVPEVQELIIGTYSLSREDWRRSRVVAWMTALLYFNKILQIPLMVVHELTGVRYRDMIDAFVRVDGNQYPELGEIRDFFMSEAESIQNGGAEYTYSEDWLGIYWPADEYVYIKMTVEGTFTRFYEEAEALLIEICESNDGLGEFEKPLREAVATNRQLVHQPFVGDDLELGLSYNIIEFYNNLREGKPATLEKRENKLLIERSKRTYDDLQKWCQEVVWWGNKKGAYLYPNNIQTKQLSGHF